MDEAGAEMEGTSKIGGSKPACSRQRITSVDFHIFLNGSFDDITVEWFKGDVYDRLFIVAERVRGWFYVCLSVLIFYSLFIVVCLCPSVCLSASLSL